MSVLGAVANRDRPRVALLIDVDNLAGACPELKTTVIDAIGQIKFAAVGLGDLAIARAYTSKPLKYRKRMHKLGYEVINAGREVDVRIAAETVSLLSSDPQIGAFILASGDRDLLSVARTLLNARRYVVIVGARRPPGASLALSANRFVPWEEIVRGKAMTEVLGGRPPILYPPTVKLRVFLCHSSGDKVAVRTLYHRLIKDGFDPWLDDEKLLPGQHWEMEISAAVRSSGVVLVCLSNGSVTKEGFVQKEIKYALDVADEKPEGTIFIIPLRLEECTVPTRLTKWHWVDDFNEPGYNRLVKALRLREKSMAPAP